MKVKYIKSHAQRLVSELASKWSDEVALELAETLTDYTEVMTGGKEAEEPKKSQSPITLPEGSKVLRLRDCHRNDIYKKIFDLAADAARLKKQSIFVTAHSLGTDAKRLYQLISNINSSNYLKVFHPHCRVSYRTVENGFELFFSKKEEEE